MDAGDWTAAGAVGISVAAAVTSVWQARTAAASAEHAKAQARAAIEANDLARQQIQRNDARVQQAAAESQEVALRQAKLVHVEVKGNGGSVQINIANRSSRAITDVEIRNVESLESGLWETWRPNANVSGQLGRATCRLIEARTGQITVAVWLLDAQQVHMRLLPQKVNVEVRFQDADGQWWLTSLSGDPQRITAPVA
ncbi:hypothetical protein [Streptomyces sp. H39-C1]|uniref:hypothetical protein n=1 Tax=Streptomyces sp. H39-C1 TaxID=3004355 RepID=UPI0022AE9CBA|nr:hypothetical protein [Streptomyces sp. H39-C1]MCZ4100802.1 hypothetical protein [Streptomyces sp. H39-C1]